jgi:hypothetical protein
MNAGNRQHTLAFAAIACVVLLAGNSLVISPLMASWKARATRLKNLQQQYSEGTRQSTRDRDVRLQWENIRTNALPDDKSKAEGKVLDAFERWSSQSSIAVNGNRLTWKDGELGRNRQLEYRTLECRVDATGSLPNLIKFLFEIEKDPMGMKVESIEVTSRDEGGQYLQLALQVSAVQIMNTNMNTKTSP